MDDQDPIGQEALDRIVGAVQRVGVPGDGQQNAQSPPRVPKPRQSADEAATEHRVVAKARTTEDERRAVDSAERSALAARRTAAATRRRAQDLRHEALAAIKRSGEIAESSAEGSLQQRVLTGGLRFLRLPLTAVENLTGRTSSTWGPALGFDIFGAAFLQAAGGLLRSESLVRAGQSMRSVANTALTAAEQLAQAQRLEAQARNHEQGELLQARKQAQRARRAAKGTKDQLAKRCNQRRDEVAQREPSRKAAAEKDRSPAQRSRVVQIDERTGSKNRSNNH